MASENKVVHQLVHTLSYGDAISGEVLALQRCLKSLGYQSEIYAINVNPRYKGMALDYRSFPQNFSGVVLLHYSLGSPLNDLYRSLTAANKWLVYHNLTPARWFEGVNPRIVSDIERGQRELPELCRLSQRLIADSRFNAGELEALGFKADVLELPIDPQRWNLETNSGIAALLKADPSIHLLHVGRLAPNKCIEDIIKVFHYLHHYVEKRSKLWLVGIDIDTELYSFSLKRLVKQLEVEKSVNFVGCMADSEVKALYENSSVYICMSEHEGFCLPVVEAMHFALPVVAYASSALPDTLGSGGVLVKEKKFPQIAELVAMLARDQSLRSKVVAAGKERVSELSYEKFEKRVSELLSGPKYAC